MRSPTEIMRSYLSRDKTGIRREVLTLFVKTRSITIAELVAELQKQFTVTFHAIASMVGIIASIPRDCIDGWYHCFPYWYSQGKPEYRWREQIRNQGKVC